MLHISNSSSLSSYITLILETFTIDTVCMYAYLYKRVKDLNPSEYQN